MGPEIRVKFLGYSSVSFGKKELTFPYLKVKLLLFIVLESRMIARERLCCLLWDNDDDKSHRNLSNALTRLRHILPSGFLIVDRRTVAVNPEWPVVSDLTPLDAENLNAKDIPALLVPFLEDIDFTDPCFAWVQARRRYYRKKLSSLLKYKLVRAEEADKIFWQSHLGHLEHLEREEQDNFDVAGETPKQEGRSGDETLKKPYDEEKRLTFEESDFLDCVAVFKTEAPFEDLKRLSQLDDRNLLRLYETLTDKKILRSRQRGEGDFTILFTDPRLQQETREKTPAVKRWSLNRRLTALLRKRLKNRPNREDLGLLVYYPTFRR